MNRRIRLIGLLPVLIVGLSYVATSYAQVNYRRYLPFANRDNGVGYTGIQELRLDDIPLWDLDARLQVHGITDASVRAWVYAKVVAARNGNVTSSAPEAIADSYPSIGGAEPDVVGRLNTGCFQGQGCHVVWLGLGTMRSHFLEARTGWMPWTFPGIKCPAPKTCQVLASIGADMSLPAINQRQYVAFGTSSLGVPVYEGWLCFWVV